MAGAAGLVAARSNAALAKAPALGTQAPAFYRFKVGTIEGTVITPSFENLPILIWTN
jgi:hypothetical protein